MNMKNWIEDVKNSPVKKPMPILSFPSVKLLDISVKELINDSELQSEGMSLIAKRVDAAAAVSMMDLSVEAEAFGSTIKFYDNEVPSVIGEIIKDEKDAKALKIPKVGDGRTGIYIDAIGKAVKKITDRPVFAGVIGPFSLAGRLLNVSEAMIYCYDEPDMVHIVLEKVTEFLTEYIRAYKAVGANGVVIAEPLAGLLTPALNLEFSVPYVKKIIDAVQDDNFIVIYHNCGGGTIDMIDGLLSFGASGYHFGNAIDMPKMVKIFPSDKAIFGNIDPASQFCNGTPESIRTATLNLLNACSEHKNFIISSGCDIPPKSKWDNIDEFFRTVKEFYSK